jgi:Flp pilus assembly pilin Flp
MLSHAFALCVRLFREDAGQDLIEYALLTAIVTVGSLAVFSAIRGKMGTSYTTWGTEVQQRWEPGDPLTSTG